ncbi:MAG: CoA transferase [Dehalococcoidia bacterium]|nr:CoA transferase [Dehalococcoidia bacterium]
MTDGALAGLRVLELGDFIAAPLCAKLLADLGAEVVKIEPAGTGDMARRFGPFPGDVPHPEKSGLFAYLNGNKLGVTLELNTASGTAMFDALLGETDILVESLQPDAARRLGVEYARVRAANPGLVMTSISTFGRTGPYSGYAGCDLTAWHGSGVAHRFLGEAGREPLRGAWYHADHWAAVGAACATMIAVLARDLTGRGQHVDVSATDLLATHIMGYQFVALYHMTHQAMARAGESQRSGAPAGLIKCQDGYMDIMALADHHWQGTIKAMGDPDWAKADIFQGRSWDRLPYAEEILDLMQPWLDQRTRDEAFAAFQAEGVPAGPIYTPADLLHHPHLEARGFFATMQHPVLGPTTVPGKPYDFSETPWALRRPAPLLGEHNAQVYCGRLGMSKEDLVALRGAGVI